MTEPIKVSAAGNTEAPALAVLESLGFKVMVSADGRWWLAQNTLCELVADGPLELLGLARMIEMRGASWRPTDEEVDHLLALNDSQAGLGYSERVDIWEEQGAVHVICQNAFGDPVELSVEEAKVLVARINLAIIAAE